MDWKRACAIVTGASSGIGLATARSFRARGAKVALVARSKDKLNALVRELGADATASFPLDVTDRAALLALPGQVKERFGRLDIVVNNAGANFRGEVIDRTPDELVAIIETNLVAPILLTRAALPLIEPSGVIVNVASLAGKVPLPHESTYSASKAGLRAFARSLDLEIALHGKGPRVTTVCPGPVDTGFFGDIADVPDLVFSQPMSTAEQIADAVIAAIESGEQEVDVPAFSGKLATAGYLLPRLYSTLRPVLAWRGARAKRAFIARKANADHR
jgi:short-subunit dehydrogenase